MPLFRFFCLQCGNDKKVLLCSKEEAVKTVVPCDFCEHPLTLGMGRPDTRALETADSYRGKKIEVGLDKMIEDRARQHSEKHKGEK